MYLGTSINSVLFQNKSIWVLKMKKFVKLTIFVTVCMLCYIGIESKRCSREAGYCVGNGTRIDCHIYNNASNNINVLLRDCVRYDQRDTIWIYKDHVETVHEDLIIELTELSSNIKSLIIASTEDDDNMMLSNISHKVFQGLTGLTYVYLDNIPGFPIKI